MTTTTTNGDARVQEREIRVSRRAQDYRLAYGARPRGLVAQFFSVILQPREYFRTMPQVGTQWLVMALVILALAGFVAVRQAELADGGGAASSPVFPPDAGMDLGIDGGMGMPMPGDMSGLPPEGFGGGGGGGAGGGDISSTWTTALKAASNLLLIWAVQALLLCEVTLFKGRAPQFGHNLRIAVWASVPLALLAGLQLLYYSMGGEVGQQGIAGLLPEWDAYAEQTPLVQALLLSLTSRLTVFWLWSVILLYFGARYALKGHWLTSMLVVVAWIAFAVAAPVVTGQIKAPETVTEIPFEDEMMPPDMDFMDEEAPFDPSIEGGAEGEMPFEPSVEGDLSGEAEMQGDISGEAGLDEDSSGEAAPNMEREANAEAVRPAAPVREESVNRP